MGKEKTDKSALCARQYNDLLKVNKDPKGRLESLKYNQQEFYSEDVSMGVNLYLAAENRSDFRWAVVRIDFSVSWRYNNCCI